MKIKKNLPQIKDSTTSRKFALEKSIRYLTIRARSVKEIYDYLLRKNFAEETINDALKKLVDLKFLNDKDFGEQWIHSRQKYRGKSKYVIKQELKMKGLSDQDINPLLENAQDDFDTARALFEKRKNNIRSSSQIDFRNKMGAYLARRGFSWEIIRKVVNEKD